MARERTVGSKTVYAGRVVTFRLDEVELANGKRVQREIVQHRGGVALVAFDSDGKLLLVRQHRAPAGETLLELPAGTLEADEDPAVCARRELEEETGYTADQLEHLVGFYLAPGYSTEFLHVYLARELREASAEQDEDEDIELVREPLETALQRIARGEIRDAKTVAGLLAYQYLRATER